MWVTRRGDELREPVPRGHSTGGAGGAGFRGVGFCGLGFRVAGGPVVNFQCDGL